MATTTSTSSQAASATTAAAIGIGGGTATTTSETIVGSHFLRIDGFSATKDLGVGKCIKSSTFRVGGHGWCIECYPCGVDEDSAGYISLFMCRQDDDDIDHGSSSSRVPPGYCRFTLIESLEDDGCVKELTAYPSILATFADADRHWIHGADFIHRDEELESLLVDDCFHVRCLVFVEKFPTAPPPAPDMATAGSHVLTVDDAYSKTRRAFLVGEAIESSKLSVGGHGWRFYFYPCGEDETKDDGRVTVHLCLDDMDDNDPVMVRFVGDDDEVKVRFEVAMLTRAGQIISSTQDFSTFSKWSGQYVCNFLIMMMEHDSSPLLQDGIQIRCDIGVVDGITAMPNLHLDDHKGISQQVSVRGDVMFEVGGHLFPAHKCVLATRSTAFMAELFGPAWNENADVTDRVRIDDMEPRVFEALLHFIYTDALPAVQEEDKQVVMAQGLLDAADRYAMERLKLICADMLCSCINDARTAVTTLDLADKYGCRRLKEACMKFLMDQFTNAAP